MGTTMSRLEEGGRSTIGRQRHTTTSVSPEARSAMSTTRCVDVSGTSGRRYENRATPPMAATVVVPLKLPPPGLAPIATITLDVSVLTRLPNASSTRTVTAGLMATPAYRKYVEDEAN